ncbi:MAG: PepSY domain-containing protein, partial [Burkholderiales bacterium]|nr:PepSY domain-containing protein [Burkholderiales bacterium]
MTTLSRNPDRSAMLMHRVFWRLHFWAGVLVAPLALFAALTGILYIFTPQIEAWKYVALDKAASSAAPRSLDQQLESAHLAFPDWSIKRIVPAYAPGSTTQVYLSLSEAASSAPTANQQTEVNTPLNAQHPAHCHHPMQPDTKGSKATEHGDHHASARTRIAYVDPGTAQLQGSLLEQDR